MPPTEPHPPQPSSSSPIPPISRRRVLAGAAALGLSPALRPLLAADPVPRFRIGACDWSIGKRGDLAAIDLAAGIGLDGVEVSFGAPGKLPHDLRDEAIRRQYAAAAEKHGVTISSLAMGVLNRIPYATSDEAERWVRQCIGVMGEMKPAPASGVLLLAFFGKGDIRGEPELQKRVIQRLKRAAPEAERAGVTLGLESWLDADAHMRILDAVDSPAVRVYYDTANMHRRGYDIYKEIRRLGSERICAIHAKEVGHLLGEGDIDFEKVREALDEIGYTGWLTIEAATVDGKSTEDCYTHNRRYLRSVFPADA